MQRQPGKVALLVTCVVDALAPGTGAAVVRVLRRRGIEVVFPQDQGCCGQPAWNSGLVREAALVARPTLKALARALAGGAEAVVCPSGSCTTMCRVHWPELFSLAGMAAEAQEARRVGERVLEFSELVARLPALPTRPDGRRVALHHSCHMLRELGLRHQPITLAERAGCQVLPWPGAERCCGFGGTFSVKLPELSAAMAEEKLRELDSLCPEALIGCDTSCLLHLAGRARARGRDLVVTHLAEVLDAAESGHG